MDEEFRELEGQGYEIFEDKVVAEAPRHSGKWKLSSEAEEKIHTAVLVALAIICVVNMGFMVNLYIKYSAQADEQAVAMVNGGDKSDSLFVFSGETTGTTSDQAASSTVGGVNNGGQSTTVITGGAAVTAQANAVLVNINTATAEELTALNGIGEKKALAIIEYRKENGGFFTVEDLTNVSGIGEKTLEKNRDMITVE